MPPTLRLPRKTEERLDRLVAATGRSKAFYLREPIINGLDRMEQEYSIAQSVIEIRAGRRRTFSSDEVRRELGLRG